MGSASETQLGYDQNKKCFCVLGAQGEQFFHVHTTKFQYHHFVSSVLSILEDNKELENILTEFQMPTMQYGTLKVAGFGETIYI